MFFSDGLDYLPVWCPTDEDMESFPKVFITPPGEWKPLYIDHDGQWKDYDDEVSIGYNVSDNSLDQAIDVLEPIMSASQHKYPTITFANDVTFTKGATYDYFFYKVTEIDTHEFDDYNGFSNSRAMGRFGTNYVYVAAREIISIISAVTAIVPTVFSVTDFVHYYSHGLSGHNIPVEVKKFTLLFLFKPENIVIKTLETTTKIGGFNQSLQMKQSNKLFPYSGSHRHKYDAIDTFFLSVPYHDGATDVELIFGTKKLLTDVYAIWFKSGLIIANFLQDCFHKHEITTNIWSDNSHEEFMGSVYKLLCAYRVRSKQY